MNAKDFAYIQQVARDYLVKLPTNCRLKGSSKDLTMTELIGLSYIHGFVNWLNSEPRSGIVSEPEFIEIDSLPDTEEPDWEVSEREIPGNKP